MSATTTPGNGVSGGKEANAVDGEAAQFDPTLASNDQQDAGQDEGETTTHRFSIKGDLTLALEKLQVSQEGGKGVEIEHGISINRVPSMGASASASSAPHSSTVVHTEQDSSTKSSENPSSGHVTQKDGKLSLTDNKRAMDNVTESHGLSLHSSHKHLPPLDLALVEAMRTPRDRLFIMEHERNMEMRIQDTNSLESWELPLMNTYQRMLVHRIADHFCLAHTVDPSTMKVILSKQHTTHIPDVDISTRASRERLSEPAVISFPSLAASVSGQKTSISNSGNSSASEASGTVPSSREFRIMRRGEGSNHRALRRHQTRAEDVWHDDPSASGSSRGAGPRKDRRELSMEEREAAYREARQRIFGVAEDQALPSSGSITPASTSSGAQRDEECSSPSNVSRNASRSSTSSNISSSALPTPPLLSHGAQANAQQDHRFSAPHYHPQPHAPAWHASSTAMNPTRMFVPLMQNPYSFAPYSQPSHHMNAGFPGPAPTTDSSLFMQYHIPVQNGNFVGNHAGNFSPQHAAQYEYNNAAPSTVYPDVVRSSRRMPSDRTLFDPSKPLPSQGSCDASRSASSAASSAPPLSRRTSSGSTASSTRQTSGNLESSASGHLSAARRPASSSTTSVASSPSAITRISHSLPSVPAGVPAAAASTSAPKHPVSLPPRPDWVMAARRGQAAATSSESVSLSTLSPSASATPSSQGDKVDAS